MSKEWKECELGDVLEIKYGKDHKKLTEGGIPCYGTGGVMRYVDKYLSQDESILIPRKGSLNNIYYIKEPFWTVDTLFWTRINKSIVFPKYLFYVLTEVDFTSLNVGSAVPSLTVPVLNNLKLNLPPLAEQKAIAKILGDLDAKIELNRKMNQTLENMAQALFNSWFVDFDPVLDNALAAGNPIPEPLQNKAEIRKKIRSEVGILPESQKVIQAMFPDSFVFNEDLGKWIPEGWEVVSMLEVANISSSKRIFAKEYKEEGVPFFRGKEISLLSKGDNFKTEIFISKERFSQLKEDYGVPQKDDILLTSVGTIGNTYLVEENDEFYFKDGNLTWFSKYKTSINGKYLKTWFASKEADYEINNIKIGSTQQAITISSLNEIKILLASNKVIVFFNKYLEGYYNKIQFNQKETETLIQQREVLLPQLVSGKVRAPQSLMEQMEKELERERG